MAEIFDTKVKRGHVGLSPRDHARLGNRVDAIGDLARLEPGSTVDETTATKVNEILDAADDNPTT